MTVLWSGDSPGNRRLVMPNEESVVVNTRIFLLSSHDAICNFSSVDPTAGRKVPIDLGYNMSVSIEVSYNGSTVTYNVYTYDSPEDYEPEDVDVSLAEHLAFVQEVGVVCAGFGAVFALAAIKVRSST